MLRWLRWYLLIFAVLLCAALVKRHIELKGLCRQVTQQLEPLASTGKDDVALLDTYFYGSYFQVLSGNWSSTPSAQGPAIFLLKRGYMDNALARAVLLTEARRLNDWQYTYQYVYNYDLRSYLIKRSLHAYPDDLAVAWAAGALSLAAGDEELALQQLGRIISKPEQWPACVALCRQLNVKPEHMLGRYCATLTLLGRDDEADRLLVALHANDSEAAQCYLRYLSDCSRYKELLNIATSGDSPYPVTQNELYKWMYDAALHDNDWLRVKTTGREKMRIFLKDIARFGGDYEYELYYDIHWMDSGAVGFAYEQGPEWAAKAKISYSAEDDEPSLVSPTGAWRSFLFGVLDLRRLAGPLATLYGQTGDGRWLKPLLRYWPNEKNKNEPYYLPDIGTQLARAYVLRGEYEQAKAVVAKWDEPPSEASAVQLLLAVSSSQRIPVQTGEGSAPDAETGGWLSSTREGDILLALLRSPQFAAALKHSGRTLDAVLPEVRAATRPQRDAYYDYANGTLDNIRRQLHLPRL